MSQDNPQMKAHVQLSSIGFESNRDIGLPKTLLEWAGWKLGDPVILTHMPGTGEAIILLQKGNHSPVAATPAQEPQRVVRTRVRKPKQVSASQQLTGEMLTTHQGEPAILTP